MVWSFPSKFCSNLRFEREMSCLKEIEVKAYFAILGKYLLAVLMSPGLILVPIGAFTLLTTFFDQLASLYV